MKNLAAIITVITVLAGAAIIGFGDLIPAKSGGGNSSKEGLRTLKDGDNETTAKPFDLKEKISEIISPEIPFLDNGALKRSDAFMIIGALENAQNHGINDKNLQTPAIEAIKANIENGKTISDEDKATLKATIIKYAEEMNGGRINWKNVSGYWLMRPEKTDYSAEFDIADANGTLPQFVDNIAPKHDAYLALVGMRHNYATYIANGDFVKIGNSITLKSGMTNEKVATLRHRLSQEGYTSLNVAPNSTTISDPNYFDDNLKQQLKNYQQAHNIKPDGELGASTLKSLEVSAKDRLKQIDLNLERERWIPKSFQVNGTPRIESNIPNQHLIYWENGQKTFEMPVIVGAVATKTPILADNVRALVFNPPWYKPKSIKGAQRIQPPGPNNALGRVKFDMENGHAIYLHDTPNHGLFSASNRTFSHGCIRLHYPKDLAEILGKSQGYDRVKIDKITSTVKTQYVKLNVKTPVLLLYRTAYVDTIDGKPDGKPIVFFSGDPYGWDKALATILYPDDGNNNGKNPNKNNNVKNNGGAAENNQLAREEFSVGAP